MKTRPDPKSQRELAELLGVSRTTVRDLIARRDFPKRRDDRTWPAGEVLAFLEMYRKRPESNLDYLRARARRVYWEAELARLKVEQAKGNLIEAHVVEADWSARMAAITDAYNRESLRLAARIGTHSTSAEILKALRAMMRRVCEKSGA